MSAACFTSPFRAVYHEAHTAWAVGAPVPQWRGACALGYLLAEEGREGDAGPALHMALMVARLLKSDEPPASRASSQPSDHGCAAVMHRAFKVPYVSCVCVLSLASAADTPYAVVALTSPGYVTLSTIAAVDSTDVDATSAGASADRSSVTVELGAETRPVAIMPTGPAECLVLCRSGALFHITAQVDAAAVRPSAPFGSGPRVAASARALPPIRHPRAGDIEGCWWSATMAWPSEALLFDDTRSIHAVQLDTVDENQDRPLESLGALTAGLASSRWQRGAACTEGLWCAGDSSADCVFRVMVVDERQRQVRSTAPSTVATSSSDDSTSSASSSRHSVLITLVAFRRPDAMPLFDFSREARRSDSDVSVRVVLMHPAPIAPPHSAANAFTLGSLLEGVTSMVTSGDGGTATLVLASALGPDLVLINLNLRAHEELYHARHHDPCDDEDEHGHDHDSPSSAHRRRSNRTADDDDDDAAATAVADELAGLDVVEEGTITFAPLPFSSASHASATAWIPPQARHPEWTEPKVWRARMPDLPLTAHVTSASAAQDTYHVAVHIVALPPQ
jgi:hypothetical protein